MARRLPPRRADGTFRPVKRRRNPLHPAGMSRAERAEYQHNRAQQRAFEAKRRTDLKKYARALLESERAYKRAGIDNRTMERGLRGRRNPGRKAPPSHDLFGERAHKTSLFDEIKYAAVPKPARKPPKRKGKAASRSQGRLSFGLGLFD